MQYILKNAISTIKRKKSSAIEKIIQTKSVSILVPLLHNNNHAHRYLPTPSQTILF